MKKLLIIATLLSSMSLMANDVQAADSINGVQIWADTCTRCHNLREPAALSKRAWKYSMTHMRVRAGLTGQETRDVLAFILESKTDEDAK